MLFIGRYLLGKPIDLSVIIVNFNTEKLLADCLRSVFSSKDDLAYEVFVVDNASADGSVKMVKKQFPQVLLLSNRENLGFAKANNQAIGKSKGRYVLLLNPDTIVEKNTFSKMVGFMDKAPTIGAATCKVVLPNGQLDRDCRRSFPTPWISFTKFSKLSRIFPKTKLFGSYQLTYLDENKKADIDACVGAFMMVRRKVIREVGVLDEDFFFYGEDLDWCYRIKKKGWRIVYYPKVKIIHYKGASSGIKHSSKQVTLATKESKRKALIASIEAMKIFYQKHYQNHYPRIVTALVFLGIWLLQKTRLLKI